MPRLRFLLVLPLGLAAFAACTAFSGSSGTDTENLDASALGDAADSAATTDGTVDPQGGDGGGADASPAPDPCQSDAGEVVMCVRFEEGSCAPFAAQTTLAIVQWVSGDAHGGHGFCRVCPGTTPPGQASTMVASVPHDAGVPNGDAGFLVRYWVRRASDAGAEPTGAGGTLDLAGGTLGFGPDPISTSWAPHEAANTGITAGLPVVGVWLSTDYSDQGATPPDGCVDFDDVVLVRAP